MSKHLKLKLFASSQRAKRVRNAIKGDGTRPRLSVNISNKHISAQIIDDSTHTTIASSTTIGSKKSGNMTELSSWVGSDIAKKAKAKKVNKVVFDRGSRLYHGRVKALADAAREGGLEL